MVFQPPTSPISLIFEDYEKNKIRLARGLSGISGFIYILYLYTVYIFNILL